MGQRVLLIVDKGVEVLKAGNFGFQRLHIILFSIAMPPVSSISLRFEYVLAGPFGSLLSLIDLLSAFLGAGQASIFCIVLRRSSTSWVQDATDPTCFCIVRQCL
jgi:hypothetical protein